MDMLSKDVVNEIKARGVAPVPRWHFLLKRSVFWTLATASVFLGAVAFAVADFVFFDNEGVSAAVLLESPLEGFLKSIPIVWLIVFGLFIFSAYYGLRHTKRGYRFRTVGVVVGVILGTIILGLGLNMLDFGQAVHDYLLTNTIFYDALINSSDDLRQ